MYGRGIRAARMRAGLTQTQLAEKVGVSRGNLNRVENDVQGIKPKTLEAICEALGITKEDLVMARRYDAQETDAIVARIKEGSALTREIQTEGIRAQVIRGMEVLAYLGELDSVRDALRPYFGDPLAPVMERLDKLTEEVRDAKKRR